MVSGIIHGVIDVLIVVFGGLVSLLVIHVLCKYHYMRGRVDGMKEEALAWCEAFDEIRVPNWQSLPAGRVVGNKTQEEEINKFYVQVFTVMKDTIGREMAMNRLDAMKKEFAQSGIQIPIPEGFQKT